MGIKVSQGFLIIAILLPVLAGISVFVIPELCRQKTVRVFMGGTLLLELLVVFCVAIFVKSHTSITLLHFTEDFDLAFAADELGKMLSLLFVGVWLAAGVFSFKYMEHEKNENRFFAFYLMTFGMMAGMVFAANLITFYMFYEFMTLLSLPFVLHSQTDEAIRAGKKYVMYSIFGAFFSLAGMFCLYQLGPGLTFVQGGSLDFTGGKSSLVLAATMFMILGFGTKAGMFPLHGWLPEAHPVAPSPASAVLSGVITKAGVLGIIRAVFYVVGADYIRGTFVQYVWIVLTLITIIMGSIMAYREPLIKKRLAYSTVSQVSYVLFGLALLNTVGYYGALLHAVGHSVMKSVLFLTASSIIFYTGKTKVEELSGIGKAMPLMMGAWTLASLGMVGIPPTVGFVSKWYLGTGSLESNMGVISYVGPVILLVSAILTAGYLLTAAIRGFLEGTENNAKMKISPLMYVPVLILAAAILILGIFPGVVI